MSKYYEEMIVFDSCYEICKAIIEKLGGTNQDWESVYQEVKYIAELVGVDTTQREYLSVYDILIDVIETLGGEDGELDSVYDQVVYIAELSGIEPKSYDATYYALLDIYESGGTGGCEKVLPIHFAVVDDISGYDDRIYQDVYDRETNNWYSLNNLNEYEEYGVMETVEALSATTSYPGKLVILSGSSTPHEYEYNNGWNDLGELDVRYAGEFDGNSWFDTGVQGKNNLCVEYEAVVTGFTNNGGSLYGSRRGTSGANCSHGQFTDTVGLTSDLGSARNTAATDYKDKELYYKGWLYTTGSSNTDVTYGIYCTLNGEETLSKTGTTTGANYTTGGNGYNMFVGALNGGGSVHTYKLKGIIKSFKISEDIDANGDGEITHDYSFREVDGVVKMYDEMTETYLPNKGTGSVTLVPAWTPIKDYDVKDEPINLYNAETYCDLYKISSDLAYVGLYATTDEDESVYVINDEKKWEETSYPTIEYDGLIFKALEGGSAVAMNNFGNNAPNLQYSFDGETWETWDYSEIDLGFEQEIAFKGTKVSTSDTAYSSFVITGNVTAKGNMSSLLDNGACTATTGVNYCFRSLFENCIGLYSISGLTLPFTVSKNRMYAKMFAECANITDCIGELPLTTPNNGDYQSMFAGCSSMAYLPDMSKITSVGSGNNMATGGMFARCNSLTEAYIPDATTDGYFTWNATYANCTNITKAYVGLKSVGGYPLADTFSGCTSLTYIEMPNYSGKTSFYDGKGWLRGCSTTGTFVKSTKSSNEARASYGIPTEWTIQFSGQTEASVSALTFNAPAFDMTIYIQTDTFEGNTWEITEYPTWCTLSTTAKTADRTAVNIVGDLNTGSTSRSGNIVITATDRVITIPVTEAAFVQPNWESALTFTSNYALRTQLEMQHYGTNTTTTKPCMLYSKDGGQTYTHWKSGNLNIDSGESASVVAYGMSSSDGNYSRFIIAGNVKASGNIMSLIDGGACTATTVPAYGFYQLFKNATGLTDVENIILPDTTANYCYQEVFRGLTSITASPVLPANDLKAGCYSRLFQGCSNLNKITTYATTVNGSSLSYWVTGVSATGDFYNLGGYTYPSGTAGIPAGWTEHTSL